MPEWRSCSKKAKALDAAAAREEQMKVNVSRSRREQTEAEEEVKTERTEERRAAWSGIVYALRLRGRVILRMIQMIVWEI